jgi:GT2 family glycosyltransferase
MALITAIAYDLERDLGRAYGEIAARLRPEDHIAFIDHDAMWTTRDWYPQLLAAIERYPDAGLFGAVTNRIGNKQQIAPGAPAGHDIREHRLFGEALQKQHGTDAIDVTNRHMLSGVLLCFTAPAIARIKFASGFFGIDNQAHRDVAKFARVLLLPGLYLYHWYRADGRGHENAPKAVRR